MCVISIDGFPIRGRGGENCGPLEHETVSIAVWVTTHSTTQDRAPCFAHRNYDLTGGL